MCQLQPTKTERALIEALAKVKDLDEELVVWKTNCLKVDRELKWWKDGKELKFLERENTMLKTHILSLKECATKVCIFF